ncbi:MAG TPA: S8 family serine peptidase, partial [Capillimicrobium sp.]
AVAANAEFLATLPAPPGGAAAVCVIDSGVDTTTDLGPALVKRSAYDGGTPDDTGALGDTGVPLAKHGTYVAGVIASQVDGVGSSGIWPAARILSRRVFSGPQTGTTAQRYITAVQWCVSEPSDRVRVINLSLAGLGATLDERGALEDKIRQVRRPPYEVNVVAAAGNQGLSFVGYPAAGTEVFAVAATDALGALTSFSNWGVGQDLAAFGASTCLTDTAGLVVGAGTSYAAPAVSAVLAALRSYRPSLSPEAAENLLVEHARNGAAGAILDAGAAFAAAGIETGSDGIGAGTCSSPPTGGGGAPAPPSPSPAPATEAPLQPEEPPQDEHTISTPDGSPTVQRRVLRPVLRRLTYTEGVLRVRVSGVEPGDRACFVVDGRSYWRSSGHLRVRVPRWRRVMVYVTRGDEQSSVLTLHRSRVE